MFFCSGAPLFLQLMGSLSSNLQQHRGSFASVVPFDPSADGLLKLDFTTGNKEITDDILKDVRTFSSYINEKLRSNKARYGIGGYGEHREIYSHSKVFD